jgi:NTP pyrophosphatase (non-canonical NTP hydrolase)
MKTYRKLKWEQDQKKPKLYAAILKYLSDESLEAIQKVQDWTDIEERVDPERLWKAIEEKHRVHSTSK